MSFPHVNHNPALGIKLVYLRSGSIGKQKGRADQNQAEEAGVIFGAGPLVALACSAERMLAPAFFRIQASESQLVRTEGSLVLGQFVVLITCISSAGEPVSSCDHTQGLEGVLNASK